MDTIVRQGLRRLLETTRVLSLGVLVDGEPEVGLLPYALSEDMGALYVQASGLARHSRGLAAGDTVGILIHAADTPDQDPMQLARLAVHGTARVLEKGTEPFTNAAARFIARFPMAAMTLELGDFNLYELTLGRGRYVEGFARAFNVGPDTYAELR
jgi:putative heme iron utilization protein